jgi:hypothetical protein
MLYRSSEATISRLSLLSTTSGCVFDAEADWNALKVSNPAKYWRETRKRVLRYIDALSDEVAFHEKWILNQTGQTLSERIATRLTIPVRDVIFVRECI